MVLVVQGVFAPLWGSSSGAAWGIPGVLGSPPVSWIPWQLTPLCLQLLGACSSGNSGCRTHWRVRAVEAADALAGFASS